MHGSLTVADALRAGTDRLRDASPTPRLDAEVLLAHVTDRERSWLLAHPEADVEGTAFEALIERRASGEPVAYIRGFKEWHSLRIRTDPRALIPRPETELLADAAIVEIHDRLARGPAVAWEVAT
ncbi:MAG TPA: protein-(glutamine-N5) methyltransferase, release factor-specific, partial [Candidatus Limnocylindria bacterium]|nr:protein-(glutamine-N5) methyltransferase, release factor-specific [Candidatus Limnocylindria bacterium]